MRQVFESLGQKPPASLGGRAMPTVSRGIRESTTSLPPEGVQTMGLPTNNTLCVSLQLSGTASSNLSPSSIGWDTMQRLTKGYFDTFNFLHPILDRQWFNSNTLNSILNHGFQEGAISSLALLVFALGEVALTTSEVPISLHKGRASGIRGGTIERPPGLAYFNEARRRMGFALAEVSMEGVQMLALAALYHASCGQALVSHALVVLYLTSSDILLGMLADDGFIIAGLPNTDIQVSSWSSLIMLIH